MEMDLWVRLGRLELCNPILTASGTFGYAQEMAPYVDFAVLGGIIPKTVTARPRKGNAPPRTVETASGLLNAIGLDNDGLDYFLAHHLPYLRTLPTAMIINIAGESVDEFVAMAKLCAGHAGIAAVELNISCPNVAHGTDFASDPGKTFEIVQRVRSVVDLPIIAKLTPNVTKIVPIAKAAADAGADAVSLANTFAGMAIDWRKAKPILGNKTGGLSGPAIKPLVLKLVYDVAAALPIPIIAVGGIRTIDDVMEFLVAGATAVQVGTVNFHDPGISARLVHELPGALAQLQAGSLAEVVGRVHRLGSQPGPPPGPHPEGVAAL
jgi:dihydroorotate dehydrogenase (NAD+) catalytic subunit